MSGHASGRPQPCDDLDVLATTMGFLKRAARLTELVINNFSHLSAKEILVGGVTSNVVGK